MNNKHIKLMSISLLSILLWLPSAHAKLKMTDNPNGGIILTDVAAVLPSELNETTAQNSKTLAKIVGGVSALRNEFPEYTLVITFDNLGNAFVCGGTIIDSRKILTAAHCVKGISQNNVFVVPGFYSFNDYNSSQELFNASIRAAAYRAHPKFSFTTFDYDAAVITLPFAVNGGRAIIYGGTESLAGLTGTPIGIGATSEGGQGPNTLRKVNVPVSENALCSSQYGRFGVSISNRMICAGFNSGGKDTCQGDSGGPLLVKFKGATLQAGITSFGIGCARPGIPGVYARTSGLVSFINQHAPGASILKNVGVTIPATSLLLD